MATVADAASPKVVESDELHVYEPHRAGLPPFIPYFRELWRRRAFAFELARTQMHASNTDTFFGQAWLVINPLLLAGVYYILVQVIGGGSHKGGAQFFATLTSGLFLFYYIVGCITTGVTSVTQGGRLILNTPFPKLLLTVSTTYQSFRRYLPTLGVYLVIHTLCGLPWTWSMLWIIPIIAMATMLGFGLANLFATVQVYFRDTSSFIPYFVRIWLYLSPILWTVEMLAAKAETSHLYALILTYSPVNPVYGILGAQGEALIEGTTPRPELLGYGLAWSVGMMVIGSLIFMSREREFAVRL